MNTDPTPFMKTFLIDDDSIFNFLTEQVLIREGFSRQIQSFLSAKEALAFIEKDFPANVPDVIFLDLNMPLMNGWEFLDALEPYNRELQGKCYIFILTSSLQLAETERAKDYNLVEGLIHKPLDGDYVQAILEEKMNNI